MPVSPSGEREPSAFDQGCEAADWPKEGRRKGEDKENRGGGTAGAQPPADRSSSLIRRQRQRKTKHVLDQCEKIYRFQPIPSTLVEMSTSVSP